MSLVFLPVGLITMTSGQRRVRNRQGVKQMFTFFYNLIMYRMTSSTYEITSLLCRRTVLYRDLGTDITRNLT